MNLGELISDIYEGWGVIGLTEWFRLSLGTLEGDSYTVEPFTGSSMSLDTLSSDVNLFLTETL